MKRRSGESLETFGLNPDGGHIINGHVPVIVKKKERPLKAGGKLIVIDGGFSRAYQKKTGIAGYTLVYNSWGLLLSTHHRRRLTLPPPWSSTILTAPLRSSRISITEFASRIPI
jgi:fructose-1,6-bisphosphatase